jgi:hypothetical protein
VRSYLRQGGWQPYQLAQRPGRLTPYREWIAERLRQHRGNCDVFVPWSSRGSAMDQI